MKKTLLIAAAALAAGVITSQAQVYSQNVAGYVNITTQPGLNQLISNPLTAPTNTLSALIPNPPPGSVFYKYTTGVGYSLYVFDEFDLVWTPNGDVALAPGEGGFLQTPTAYTNTFVGNVVTGTSTNAVPAGYAIRSSKVSKGGLVTTDLGFPAAPNDVVYKYTPGSGYSLYVFDEFDLVWTPSEPSIPVGQSFFSFKAAPVNWVQTYNP